MRIFHHFHLGSKSDNAPPPLLALDMTSLDVPLQLHNDKGTSTFRNVCEVYRSIIIQHDAEILEVNVWTKTVWKTLFEKTVWKTLFCITV